MPRGRRLIGGAVTLGRASGQAGLWDVAVRRCEASLPERSIYRLLHAERDQLFPDELFANLFASVGRRSVPPSVVAVVMVLQRLEGLSDREAVDRVAFDLRWRTRSRTSRSPIDHLSWCGGR